VDQHQWDERYASTELVWAAEANRFVVEELADLAAGRGLDLGAGEGRNAIWLAERGWRVTGRSAPDLPVGSSHMDTLEGIVQGSEETR